MPKPFDSLKEAVDFYKRIGHELVENRFTNSLKKSAVFWNGEGHYFWVTKETDSAIVCDFYSCYRGAKEREESNKHE